MNRINSVWNNSVLGIPAYLLLCCIIVWNRISTQLFSVIHKANMSTCGKNVILSRGLTYRYPKNIHIGNNVYIDKNVSFSTESANAELTIGSGSTIGFNCFIDFSGNVRIGENVRIASNSYIMTHTHGYDPNAPAKGIPLEIDNSAFIGSGSVILYNCKRIGKKAVIGVGSIVTKDVPDFAIVAGNPARIIKYINNESE